MEKRVYNFRVISDLKIMVTDQSTDDTGVTNVGMTHAYIFYSYVILFIYASE